MSEERNAIPLIITGICSIIGTVGALWYYGYLHFAKPEDALLLSDFTMLKTIPGEDYKVSLTPANQVAQCIDGIIVLFDTEQKGLTGVLVAMAPEESAWPSTSTAVLGSPSTTFATRVNGPSMEGISKSGRVALNELSAKATITSKFSRRSSCKLLSLIATRRRGSYSSSQA